MITTVYTSKPRQGHFAMPAFRCADGAWLRALPQPTVDVSVQGTGVSAAADLTFQGTRAWSPPT